MSDLNVGDKVRVTPKDGSAAYDAYVRGEHEDGYTLWLDVEAKDQGEVRTVVTKGPHANASVEAAQ